MVSFVLNELLKRRRGSQKDQTYFFPTYKTQIHAILGIFFINVEAFRCDQMSLLIFIVLLVQAFVRCLLAEEGFSEIEIAMLKLLLCLFIKIL
jgi:hypothetical protein